MKARSPSGYFWSLCLLVLQTGCQIGEPQSVRVGDKPYEKLSDYAFFQGELKQLIPNQGVMPYDLITPLFSDYAEKARFVWMPAGSSARLVEEEETFDFPPQSVLIKNFYYPVDARNPQLGNQILETRLLIRGTNKWEAWSYIWNEQQTDAFLNIAGDIKPLSWINERGLTQQVSYVVPNKNQCKGCHEYKKQLQPVGPKVRHLNKTFGYEDGEQNQLIKWQEVGYLRGMERSPQEYRTIAAWDDPQVLLQDRALAYMEVNCGICHSEHGPAGISGLYLTSSQTDPDHLGFCKSPVSAGSGSGGRDYDIVPGDPDGSILLYRMQSLNPGEMMPELGRTVIHTEGVALIREWILSLEGECGEEGMNYEL